jgi:hypothetical protein
MKAISSAVAGQAPLADSSRSTKAPGFSECRYPALNRASPDGRRVRHGQRSIAFVGQHLAHLTVNSSLSLLHLSHVAGMN